jgi:hypothetical protein
MAELMALQAKMKGKSLESSIPANVPKENKFHAVMTEAAGIKFASKKEARYYLELVCRQKAGEIKFFLMQVPFRLPGKTIHRVDFMIVRPDMTIEFIEVKGKDLQLGRIKRRQVEEIFGVEIKVV